MSPLDAFWHLLNFLAPPLLVAVLLVGLAKGLVWRLPLRATPWRLLWAQCALLGVFGQVVALLWLGHEGKLESYALWLGLLSLPLVWRLMRKP
ncbi:MAG: hypothetical protein ACK4F7_05090 [Inhella sp.]